MPRRGDVLVRLANTKQYRVGMATSVNKTSHFVMIPVTGGDDVNDLYDESFWNRWTKPYPKTMTFKPRNAVEDLKKRHGL